ncbi:bifunctional aspartate kinase/homoserine dehydrogenase I [Marinilabilia salmonicolor]|uniref:bifunctional aspartate kinase/homoserine dehydrogenase I n=1 Tax=Marinilabilia salmonicolor TaxID=989 RepID=UPI000A6F78D7|nr:bifunctional aspartate kinase/homoserine dehydrogenase I [Marinilabilia salmonicolor]
MKILKFGGTSVGSADNIRRVKDIIQNQNDQVVIVVSALGGITDRLIKAATMAAEGDGQYASEVKQIVEIHQNTIVSLFSDEKKQQEVSDLVAPELDELNSITKGVFLIRELSRKSLESISGIGERLSSKIISSFLDAKWFDSRKYIKTFVEYGKSQVDLEATNNLLPAIASDLDKISLFPGFISSNKKGDNTTLGRGGSDYTASLLAASFNASMLEIWTDVNGFMTADPKVISRAYCIEHLSYAEAMELSHFGAKVIYPPTILPAYQKKIPITIKNSFNPEAPGTLIDGHKETPKPRQIKGISSIKNVSLLTVHGMGMVGVSGISMRLFASLAAQEINVILISQASSENSISIVIESDQSSKARKAIEKEFKRELEDRHISGIDIDDQMAVVAIVGENMKHTTGMSGLLFNSVGKNGVNVYAIAQGASELNISFVIKERDIKKALNVIHESFFLSDYSRLNLFLVGKGTVGSKLLNKIAAQSEKLMKENRLKIRLIGLAGRKGMILNNEGMDASTAIEKLDKEGIAGTVGDFRDKIIEMNLANSVFVDCSASGEVASIYQSLLDANVSVVTANKIASSSSFSTYKKLKDTAREKGVRFFFETNVGAGLPIIAPINDLVRSGDKIVRLEAVLSGTLNYIVNTLSEDKPCRRLSLKLKKKDLVSPIHGLTLVVPMWFENH